MAIYIILKLHLFDRTIIIVNVYGPNNDNPDFFEHLEEMVESLGSPEHIIFGGDWNLVRNYELDCFNYRRQNNVNASNQVDELCRNLDLFDVWRDRNPETRRYTWRRPTPLQQSRIDFFLVTDLLAAHLISSDISPGYRTDHSLITLTLQFEQEGERLQFWKFNASLLHDKKYLDDINGVIKEVI